MRSATAAVGLEDIMVCGFLSKDSHSAQNVRCETLKLVPVFNLSKVLVLFGSFKSYNLSK